MEFQRADIDVQLHGWGRYSNVSEKFREKDYNDLYLELYSMYPTQQGWMKNSEASHLAYFFPKRMVWLDKKLLTKKFDELLLPIIDSSKIETLVRSFPQAIGSLVDKFELNNEVHSIRYIKAFNQSASKTWDTIGISITFDALKQIGVDFRAYKC